MTLDVCICTHSPRADVLALAIGALARQTAAPGFRVLLVDSASEPRVPEAVLEPLRARGIAARLVREPEAGVARARRRAIDETDGAWLLFVDDDNELADDYVEVGLRWAASRPDVGSFGGRLLLGERVRVPRWAAPFLPYLAIKDAGDAVITGASLDWGPWEPPTSGAFVRRDLAEAYRRRVAEDPRALALGRKGRAGLASGEDALMMRQAGSLGLLNAYQPALSLRHHIDQRRLEPRYLARFMWAFGVSHAVLEHLLPGHPGTPREYRRLDRFLRLAWRRFKGESRRSLAFGLGILLLLLGARAAHRDADRAARGRIADPGAGVGPRPQLDSGEAA
jgi:hypothetical protein